MSSVFEKAKDKIKSISKKEPVRITSYGINKLVKKINYSCGLNINHVGPDYLKIHGLLRSGTNYLSKLISSNFKAIVLKHSELGWKHGPCQYEKFSNFIFISKNPYSWLLSFKYWEEIHLRSEPGKLKKFIEAPISHTELREVWKAENPIIAWNKCMNSWLKTSKKNNTLFIRYEDLLMDYGDLLGKVQNKFEYESRSSHFHNLTQRADDWETKVPRKKLDLSYYTNESYMDEYSPEDLETVRLYLDADLTKKLGYKIF